MGRASGQPAVGHEGHLMLSNLVRRVCSSIAKRLPKRIITEHDGADDVYLERYYMAGREPKYFPEEVKTRLGFLPWIFFLHRFARSDSDEELHNHPFPGLSFILYGGYSEERRHGNSVRRRLVKPFRFNLIRENDFHRVDLLKDECWTIFIVGKKSQSWGFWDRHTGCYLHWKEHLCKRNEMARLRRQMAAGMQRLDNASYTTPREALRSLGLKN